MKKHLLIAAFAFAGLMKAEAQTMVSDSITVGAGYANQTYYSFANGTVKSEPLTNWDLGFGASGMSATIIFNAAGGNKLCVIPGKTPADFASADTAGLNGFPSYYNSDTTYAQGALNQGAAAGSQTDLGWGEYNITTHIVEGTKVYVVKYANKSAKKFYIQDLTSGVYTVVVANIDNSAQQTLTFTKSNYSTKNFGYLSFANGALDREPATADWDIVFGKYITFIPSAYGVTGVLTNKGVIVAKVEHQSTATSTPNGHSYATAINTIGYDWKSYNGATNSYVLTDSLSYFVKNKAGNIYKLVLTKFAGSSTGKIYFNKQAVIATGINDVKGNNVATLGLYPNPASGSVHVILNNESNVSNAVIAIYDLTGKQVYNNTVNAGNGLSQHEVNTADLTAGLYIVKVLIGNYQLTSKLSVNN